MSAPRVALVFPGQGAQKVGMGRDLQAASPAARAIYERADAALGSALSRICFEGPEETLRLTATTQPAVLATGVAAFAALGERLPEARGLVACVAGHSLGEYAALVAAGALEFEDAVRVVRRRGEYMQEAVPVGDGAMAAVLGAALRDVEALCAEAAEGDVLSPANLNAPDQTVVAGTAAAVGRLAALARDRGTGKVVRLPVSAPFHCALMAPARARLAADVARLRLRDATLPVVVNVGARATTDAEALREALIEQVTAPVRWVESIHAFRALGASMQIECGPGKVLSGLARRTDPTLVLLNVEDSASLEATVGALVGSERGRPRTEARA